jgi:two-component system cell cycle sensor histidine kinase/response regulator CckA
MQAVGQLAGGVAHDFNNILTAIIGHCDLMLMRHTPGDTDYHDLQQVKANSNRAAALTRQLLAFSRQQTLRPQVLQLPDVVSEVSSLLKRLLGENISLDVTHGRNLGAVRADPGQLEQVIVNLVVNARHAMPEGGTVSIRTFAMQAAQVREMKNDFMPIGEYTGLSVTDTGIGIAPEVIGKIFEPFYTTKEVGKGTGLGLATVFGIVRQHGGSVRVTSELERGSSFDVYLPELPSDSRDSDRHLFASAAATQSQARGGPEAILLVEDEESVRRLVQRVLREAGYRVLTAASGAEALSLLEEDDFAVDLVLTDLIMPGGISGQDLGRRVRELRPDQRILYMSGYPSDHAGHDVPDKLRLDAGARTLTKPFTPASLLDSVRACLKAI